MNRFNRLLQKQLAKPQTFSQLKSTPFPYLNDCNRLQIFQFIHQLQSQNLRLRGQLGVKFPGKILQQISQESSRLQLRKRLIGIHRESIDKMQVEVRSKREELEGLRVVNEQLERESASLQGEIGVAEARMMEVEREKRQGEFQLRMHEERLAQQDTSQIFKRLYGEVKEILEESL